jgi:squalene-hopene/tetraprenyl-beta-curcumene cyclase
VKYSIGHTAPPTGDDGWRLRTSVAHVIEQGTEFLVGNQGRDGLWRDFLTPAGEASHWPSGFIGSALHLAAADLSSLERAGNALMASQNLDGGWGYNEDVPSDADSTAWVLLFLTRLGERGSVCRRAASCLVRHQRPNSGGLATYDRPGPIREFTGLGRWVPFTGWCMPHTEVTAVAGRALAAFSADHCPAETQAAWEFVRSKQGGTGQWCSYWWTSPHYTTLEAVQLAHLFGDNDAISRAADWAIRTQSDNGGCGVPDYPESAFATALCLSILIHADPGSDAARQAVLTLMAMQDADGGWPSCPIMRIPVPPDCDPSGESRWRLVRFGGGMVIADQHRTFTSAACVAALVRWFTAGSR